MTAREEMLLRVLDRLEELRLAAPRHGLPMLRMLLALLPAPVAAVAMAGPDDEFRLHGAVMPQDPDEDGAPAPRPYPGQVDLFGDVIEDDA